MVPPVLRMRTVGTVTTDCLPRTALSVVVHTLVRPEATCYPGVLGILSGMTVALDTGLSSSDGKIFHHDENIVTRGKI